MARRVLYENSTHPNYSFNPATKTLIIPHYYPAERFVLITNITAGNKVIYNFSDTVLTATITPGSPSSTQTTIVFAYNTGSMSATDKLSILVDEVNEYITPSETLVDPVGKLRTSTPQSLIDTDFEYGLQPTKWETLNLLNNRATYYSDAKQPLVVSDITTTAGSKTGVITFTQVLGTGTISNTGSLITGSSTTFLNQIVPGYALYNSSNVFVGLVSTVANNTSLQLQANANVTLSGATFYYAPTQIPEAGTPIQIQDSFNDYFNGLYIADSKTNANVSYTATSSANATESIFNSAITQVFSGGYYTGAKYNVSSITYSGNLVTFTTTEPHGLNIGSDIYCYGLTASSNAPNGNWTVVTVTSQTVFAVRVTLIPTGSITVSGITNAGVYARPYGITAHRPFDGGTSLSCGTGAQGNALIRQTRRYFRYQSGKGIQWSTGTILRPNIIVDQIASFSYTITVTTKTAHNLFPGVVVTIGGATDSAYNGAFTVLDTPTNYTFTVLAATLPASTQASGNFILSVTNWNGATARMGLFTATNGMFFEYDGQTLYAVRRSSTTQLSGYVNVTNGSSTVTGATVNGVSTLFSRQLLPGQFIAIRGLPYRIMSIASDTSMQISPPYRGVTLSGKSVAVVSELIETRIPQSSWNLDRMDGTGPSGYNIDLSKIQMFYIDYSWYGAGAARFGFKDQHGQVIYCHRFIHNNQLTEAFLRSGNLPARYEVNTYVPETQLTSSDTGLDFINVTSTTGFPNTGTLLIRDPANYEYVNYTGKTSATFTGLTRGKTGNTDPGFICTSNTGNTFITTTSPVANLQINQRITSNVIPTGTFITSIIPGSPSNIIRLSRAALNSVSVTMNVDPMGSTTSTHTYSATAPITVALAAPEFVPTISHWGSSVIMDGRYDDDKSFVFSTPSTSSLTIAPGVTNAVLSIRLAPSVDSGVVGLLGQREVINTMQLTLRQMDVFTNGNFLVKLVLNGTVDPGDIWQTAGAPSLSQVCYHQTGRSVRGGDLIYAFFVNNAGAGTFTATQQDLNLVRDMGNSIYGGGTTNSAGSQVFPDGPDVVTVVVTSLNAAAQQIFSRLSWTEAQA
jgi:hypothetical protein